MNEKIYSMTVTLKQSTEEELSYDEGISLRQLTKPEKPLSCRLLLEDGRAFTGFVDMDFANQMPGWSENKLKEFQNTLQTIADCSESLRGKNILIIMNNEICIKF